MGFGMSNSSSMGAMKGPPKFNDKVPKGYKAGAIQQFTPEQMQLFSQMFGDVGPDSFLSQIAGGDEEAFNQLEAPALRQFSGLQGNLASRFSGMGTGARHGSGFQNAAGAQASDFAQQLQSNRLDLRRQALNDLMGMRNELLNQRPYQRTITEKQKPWWQSMASEFGHSFAKGAGEQLGSNVFGGGGGGGGSMPMPPIPA
jgi:hypothetical protein